jgi:hypothetical protein
MNANAKKVSAVATPVVVTEVHKLPSKPEDFYPISDVDLKVLAAAIKLEQRRRTEARKEHMPKVGQLVKVVRGPKVWLGKEAAVIHLVGTRIVANVPGVGERVLALRDFEKIPA